MSEAIILLSNCRDRLAQGVMTAFVQHVGRASDEFLNLADRATTQEQQQIYFAAMSFLSHRTQTLIDQFQRSYATHFDATANQLRSVAPAPTDFALPDELTLIDPDDFERDLAISKIATRAAFNCSQQLVALDRRMAVLLQVQRLSQDDNPLYPGALFNALVHALGELGVERGLTLALLQTFERHTAAALPGLYADLNRYLAEAGVLPTIPVTAPATPNIAGQFSGGAAAGGYAPRMAAPAAASAYNVGGDGAPLVNEDVFSQLLQAIQTVNRAAPMQENWSTAALPMPPAAMHTSAAPAVSIHQLMDALGNLQHGQLDPRTMPGVGMVQMASPSQQDNLLRQIRATPMASRSHPMDAMTIDIVSMLFDAIFNDPDLSATLRAEIAKLQIPVLKVALIDKTFFSDRKHPTRRLLDTIANSGIGRGEQDESRLTAEICAIVDSVVSEFDSDTQIFSAQVQRLEAFLKEEEGRARDNAEQMVNQLASVERKEVALLRANSAVQSRRERPMPPLISDFLERHWRLVLVDIDLRNTDNSADWQEAVTLMDDLIWSVELKTSAAERERLLALLPNLLKRLRQNLEQLKLDEAWDAFFRELIRLHMAALRADPTPVAPVPPVMPVAVTPTPAPAVAPPPIAPKTNIAPPPVAAPPPVISLSKQDVAPIVSPVIPIAPASPIPPLAAVPVTPPLPITPTAAPLAEMPQDPHLRLVQALEVGAWIEFQSLRGTRNTLRLNWVSDLKRVYLFTNRQGENAMTLAATSLADHLRKGTARLLSQNPLTDRAVAQVLEKFRTATPA
ncbi:DUF1631 domain-containing protein [Chromatium okenii]|uniref:DUF1631 domain-containing protein n=1 Tax=Chromatium okenii TaxID=61644 RepID=UPI0026EAD70C|nr:DUF1631 domain-containing protein [Chromatium okenii]MBV5309558.1 DUF1631 domain-containing protein [Chromatium okenii]